MTPLPSQRQCIKTAIEEGAAKIEELAQAVEGVKAETQEAVRNVKVQTRYASRVQSVARGTPPFLEAMATLIEADRAALAAKGK